MPGLSDAEKCEYEKQVDAAKTIEEVEQVVADAKAKNDQNLAEKALEESKNNGKEAINNNPNLTEKDKDELGKKEMKPKVQRTSQK